MSIRRVTDWHGNTTNEVTWWGRNHDDTVKKLRDWTADVRAAQARIAADEALIANVVQQLRAAGASWAVVGDILGVTKAAAHKRWGHTELTSSEPSTQRHADVDVSVNPPTRPPRGSRASTVQYASQLDHPPSC